MHSTCKYSKESATFRLLAVISARLNVERTYAAQYHEWNFAVALENDSSSLWENLQHSLPGSDCDVDVFHCIVLRLFREHSALRVVFPDTRN